MLQGDVLPGGVVRGRKNPLHFGLSLRLKRARSAAGLSIRGLADAAGLVHGVVRYVEGGAAGQRAPGLDTIERLARALGVSPCWLAYGEEGPLPFQQKRPQAEQPAYQGADVPVMVEGGPLLCEGIPLRLQAARDARGLSRRALGRASATSDTTVRQVEEGDILPSVATVEKLAAALDVAPCWLAYGQGAAHAAPPVVLDAEEPLTFAASLSDEYAYAWAELVTGSQVAEALGMTPAAWRKMYEGDPQLVCLAVPKPEPAGVVLLWPLAKVEAYLQEKRGR